MEPFVFKEKAYENPLQAAARKYPKENWTVQCQLGPEPFTRKCFECMDYLKKGPIACTDHDTVFGDVVRGCSDSSIVKTGDDKFEMFRNDIWVLDVTHKYLKDFVRNELARIFAPGGGRAPPVPLERDSFITKVCSCVVSYMAETDEAPLDHASHYKLLDKSGKVYDFRSDTFRRAIADDRLYRHLPNEFQYVPMDKYNNIVRFCNMLYEYYLSGGNSLKEDEAENDTQEAMERADLRQRIRNEYEKMCGIFVGPRPHGSQPPDTMLRGIHNLFEDIDLVVFQMRIFSRVISGTKAFAEFYAYTGPVNGGKRFLMNIVIKFLGSGARFLTQVMVSNFLTSPMREDA